MRPPVAHYTPTLYGWPSVVRCLPPPPSPLPMAHWLLPLLLLFTPTTSYVHVSVSPSFCFRPKQESLDLLLIVSYQHTRGNEFCIEISRLCSTFETQKDTVSPRQLSTFAKQKDQAFHVEDSFVQWKHPVYPCQQSPTVWKQSATQDTLSPFSNFWKPKAAPTSSIVTTYPTFQQLRSNQTKGLAKLSSSRDSSFNFSYICKQTIIKNQSRHLLTRNLF